MIEETLKQRGNNYGNFHTQANLCQTLDKIIKQHYCAIHPDQPMPEFMAEAIHMICHKLARIANGNPFYDDSWHDIGGYSQLVVDILRDNAAAEEVNTKKEMVNDASTV